MHVTDKNASMCTHTSARVWWRETFPEDEGDKRQRGPLQQCGYQRN